MRVISGKARGTKLETIEGQETRPTTDRVKESLFNMIQFDIRNQQVLDLFAGSGALGIEAASRGASSVKLVENNQACRQIIEKNMEKTHLDNISFELMDSFQFLEHTMEKFDVIFLDPPYFKGMDQRAIELILENEVLNSNGLIVVERDKKDKTTLEFNGLTTIKEKRYGRTNIIIFRRQ